MLILVVWCRYQYGGGMVTAVVWWYGGTTIHGMMKKVATRRNEWLPTYILLYVFHMCVMCKINLVYVFIQTQQGWKYSGRGKINRRRDHESKAEASD